MGPDVGTKLYRDQMQQRLLKVLKVTGNCVLWAFVLAGVIWGFGAIWFLEYLPGWLAMSLAIVYMAVAIQQLRGHMAGRNEWARPVLAASIPLIYGATLLVQPTNERVWANDLQLLPEVIVGDGKVVIRNFRDFRYHTPEEPIRKYDQLAFDLEQLESVWFIVQRFTRYNGMAHTFVSFGLDTPEGKKYFSISVEVRRERGELYSPIAGIYRNYELMYVVGSEQDLIGVRTNVRENDRVYLFRGNATPQQTQQLFLQFADRLETLRQQPEFYSTFLNNCTNNIVVHTWSLTDERISTYSPRIILPGYSAQVAWEHGLIGQPGQSFEEMQEQSRVDELARKAGISASFSSDIRTGSR